MGLFTRNTTSGNGAAAAGKDAAVKPSAVPGTDASSLIPPPRPYLPAVSPQLSERQLYMQQLKVRIHQQLVERLDVQNLRSLPPETVRSEVRVLIRELCQSEKGLINSVEQEKL